MKYLKSLHPNEILFESKIGVHSPNFLKHHRVYNDAVMPAAAYLEMVLAAGISLYKSDNCAIVDFVIQQALIFPDEQLQTIQLIFSPKDAQSYSFEIFSLTSGQEHSFSERLLHAFGKVVVRDQGPKQAPINLPEMLTQSLEKLSIEAYYEDCRKRGVDYGSSFQVMENLWVHDGEAIAEIKLPHTLHQESGNYQIHPVLIDACIQVLWAALPEFAKAETYLPVSLECLKLFHPPGDRLWSQARLRPLKNLSNPRLTADLYLFNEDGILILEIEGLFIERVSQRILDRDLLQKQTIAITATFTADPIQDSLTFWMKELNLPSKVEFAPYNQIFQQLLDPTSLIGNNQQGVNVVLLRLEDWEQEKEQSTIRVNSTLKEELLGNQLRYTLPNNQEIAHLNPYETKYLYQEIFVDQVYLKHGIVLNDGDCVVDIGANIGLFSLFVLDKCPNASIYAFEPAPHAFDILSRNTKLYGKNVYAFNCGVSGENREETFTFYPNSSVFSSFAADVEQDEKAIRAVIVNMLRENNSLEGEALESLADKLLVGRLEQQSYDVQLLSLSHVIEENQLQQIDLLKVDAEKSELPVLQGIEDRHWSRIKQIVVEVHDQEGSIFTQVKQLLEEKGFVLAVEEENLLQGSGLYNIYASRSTQISPVSVKESPTNKIEPLIHDLADALKGAVQRTATPYILCICPPSPTVVGDDNRNAVYQQMEDLLASSLDGVNGIYLMRSLQLATQYPVANFYDAHGDRFGHVPYTSAFFTALGTAIARKIHTLQSPPHKVIALDCDGTLWKGVCGEEGAAGIVIDAPHIALQEFLLKQYEAGMLISLCSKNNEADVWAVFEQRPEMRLKRHHLVSWQINWNRKSDNIKSLASELQLGIDSFIFIDDNPLECAEVKANCPEVLVLQLPGCSDRIPQFLDHVWAFDHLQVTEESKQRTQLYQQNRDRQNLREKTLTFSDFLASLELKVNLSPMTPEQVVRVSQLTMRTNQFNFTGKRRSVSEIQQLCDSQQLECLVTQAGDRFGDYGLVGVVLFEIVADALNVDTFLLSCRALGKGIEHTMLAKLGDMAKSLGLSYVNVMYLPTEKNQVALNFLEGIGGNFQQRLDTGWVFKFPVDVATYITYRPIDSESVDYYPSRVNQKLLTVNSKPQTFTIGRIATELYDPMTVLKAIESEKQTVKPDVEIPFVAATNEREKALVDIWSEVLKREKIGIDQNFFEIGGSSLLLVQVYSKLRERFKWNILPVDLYQYPTIKALAEYVGEGDLLDKNKSTSSNSCLIPIQPQGSKPPLFCIHILGRGLQFYRPLAKYLGLEQPLYGLNLQVVNDELNIPNRVEDIAAHYIQEMRTLQPEGPYYLVGLSFGGTVAFEMAQQLVKQGQQVALLALLDTYGVNAFSYVPISKQVLNHWQNFSKSGFSYVTSKVRENLMGRFDSFKKLINVNLKKLTCRFYQLKGIPLSEDLQDFSFQAQNLEADSNYVPQVYPGHLTLFFSLDKHYRISYTVEPTLGWGNLAEKGSEIYEIPGSHLGMMAEPYVAVLAEKLQGCIEESKINYPRT